MQLDLGLQGMAILLAISLVFGVLVQLIGRAGSRWEWLTAATAWFIGGFVASEVVWGTFTEDDIQPIIDGLAFDESLLGGLVLGIPLAIVVRLLSRRAERAASA